MEDSRRTQRVVTELCGGGHLVLQRVMTKGGHEGSWNVVTEGYSEWL